MSGDNGDAGPRLPVLRDREGEQGTLVPNGRVKVKHGIAMPDSWI